MAVTITEDEKSRARHHLGYLEVEAAQTFVLGVPAALQTTFMIEGALNRLTPTGAQRFRELLCRLDAVENQVFCGIDLADVEKLDSIDVNRKRLGELAQYYKIAQQGLANLLGVPANPWDAREWLMGGIVNVPVM
jgi:hypothetical protein